MKRSAELPGAALVVWGALFFNWVLAFINAHGINISPSYVALCEILLMASAMAWVLKQGLVRDQVFVLLVYVGCFVFTLLRFAYAEAFDLKSMRDLAIIFVFICLGLSSRAQPYKLVYYVTLAIAAIGIVEILFPDIYYGLLNIKQYYINSRGFTEADFWNTNSDLFVSGTRPGERFFLAFTNWPRASSVFLEPVSLGNFIIVSLTVLLAGWKKLPLVPVVIWAT
ncbi:MAG: GumE protein, partial [Verrucomicrobiaceae bacterium]|nr:GumE protein [Verrucomicrobiaceae bacterium]